MVRRRGPGAGRAPARPRFAWAGPPVSRAHADPVVAAKAAKVIAELKGPEQKEKDALIARLRPEVLKPGDAANGAKLFTQNCAVCHKLKNEGADFAPNLTGMGAHGPEDLMVHILDPNRVVEPNF